uniref:Uncharacterized protein n=1 Tax=Timspurckia oligopyrenoides TaxID=708627 RepID=A0A7S0ZG42_9RHOD|mmetsp:Transcript_3943/g.6894  ORF Transcript_3943/g.6894 Transcript_3943/m.6894 type:complete len:126 (+) Transcript_3943:122-499(+)|eukprot:CAMPEP_0182452582 /NCGR_PEP_ID=MMETSP1172-20130603/44327_1 /TAXON_ID=708627 /ORGANISM="Timspurckia oligopyrenoides, Strain CCMP3278" /LENGTH=125 /DNA_ID=CAMNT_0024650425 /DNA_START=91 /DNA_END=468 /DNA_ORIENTATION=-
METFVSWFSGFQNELEDAKYWAEQTFGFFEDEEINENTIANESTLSREQALALWNSMDLRLERDRFENEVVVNAPTQKHHKKMHRPSKKAESEKEDSDVESQASSTSSMKSVCFNETVVVVTFET